ALVCAVTIAGLWFYPLAASVWAEDDGRANDGWAFGSAAMELSRLPPTKAGSDSSWQEVSVTADVSAVPPVSLTAVHSSHVPDQWDDFGTRLYLGYDRGFVIGADQGVGTSAESVDFLMRVNSWAQLRQTSFESEGPNADQNTFSFERLRLSFSGHILSRDMKYFFQFDGNSDRSTDAIFLDYFTTFDLGHSLFGIEENRFGIKLGKWKVPFSRSREESGRLLQFSDRATANILFDLNRSVGVGLTSKLDPLDRMGPSEGPVELETAIFNGFKTGSTSTNRSDGTSGLDRNFGWSLRGHADLLGDFGSDGESDLSWHCAPALRLGGGLAFIRIDAEGPSEFSRQRVVDSGMPLSDLVPATVSAYDVWLYTIDAHFKHHGLSVIAEYYWRYMTQFKGAAVSSLLDDGFVLQTGYFVVAEKLELITRWSRIAGDSGTLGLINESSDEVGAGFVWYFKGHNAKLTFDATHVNGVPVSSSRLDLLPSDAGWLFRTQIQLAF
ncbi:MAG: porin, partial [Pirellulaceae bacterium]|nr:porin [Pirellulaceae bacterium]